MEGGSNFQLLFPKTIRQGMTKPWQQNKHKNQSNSYNTFQTFPVAQGASRAFHKERCKARLNKTPYGKNSSRSIHRSCNSSVIKWRISEFKQNNKRVKQSILECHPLLTFRKHIMSGMYHSFDEKLENDYYSLIRNNLRK